MYNLENQNLEPNFYGDQKLPNTCYIKASLKYSAYFVYERANHKS